MELVLSLREALSRLTEPPEPSVLRVFASALLVPLEHQKLQTIACPACGASDWEKVMQEALAPRQDINWPYSCPGGDRLHCRCGSCGHYLTVTFWFTE